HGDRAMRAFNGGDRLLQRLLCRRAVAAITEAFERHAVLELLHGRGEDGRGVIDGRIDDAEVGVRIAAGDAQYSVWSGISFRRGHATTMAQASLWRPAIEVRPEHARVLQILLLTPNDAKACLAIGLQCSRMIDRIGVEPERVHVAVEGAR